jgi:hypothetical protein
LSFPFPSRRDRRRRAGLPLGLVIALALLLPALTVPCARAATPGPGDSDPALYDPVLASQRDAVYAETEGQLPRFDIDATFSPATETALATIDGTVDLRYVNNTADDLTELYLRLYPNSEEYGDGAMTIDRVVDGGGELDVELSVADTLATVELPQPLPVGKAVDLELAFTSTIPTDPIGSYGMFSFDRETGSYALAHWLPLLAGYDPVNGWELGLPSKQGDPVFTNTALFDVSITSSAEYVLVTTGSEVESTPEGDDVTRRFVSGPVRDFAMAADDDFQVESITVGETTVNSYFNPDSADGGLAVLTAGAQSLETYSRLAGVYPYAEMNLVEIDLGNGAGGVEFPQLMFIGRDYYGSNEPAQVIPGYLEFIVAHEVAHQWWYALVGNNQYRHAFLDEGLANYLATVYFAEVYGEEAGQQQTNFNLKAAYFSLLFNDGDQVVDQPTDDFPSQRAYGSIVYGKAALAFGAIRDEIGDDAFFTALHSYTETFAFQVASPEDLKAAFETASGKDLGEFWRHWFDAAEGDQDFDAADLARLLREIGR